MLKILKGFSTKNPLKDENFSRFSGTKNYMIGLQKRILQD